MKNFMIAAATCALLSTLSTNAVAGGDNGGSKNSGRIRVTNNSDEVAAVIVDVDDANPPADEDEFLDAGGKLIQPGRSATFRVSRGEHTVTALLVDDDGTELGVEDQISVDVEGGTLRLSVTGEDDATIQED
jgi:hypothetical protein